jgi:undecaprenyl-diphosphatase
MDSLQSVALGVVQGLTEFLPISSSAHLVLTPFFFSWTDPGLAYDVALHMGTLAAVLLFFWRDWLGVARQLVPGTPKGTGADWKLLAIGTLPAAVAGLALGKHAEETFRNPLLIAGTLVAFGALLWFFDRKGLKARAIEALSYRDALIIGTAQALAIVPGVSRSGITITAALALGLTRSAATRFSFLLSAPIIAGAGMMKADQIVAAIMAGGAQAYAVGIGFLSSLVSGFLAIGLLSYMVKSNGFGVFVAYRFVLSLIIIVIVLR